MKNYRFGKSMSMNNLRKLSKSGNVTPINTTSANFTLMANTAVKKQKRIQSRRILDCRTANRKSNPNLIKIKTRARAGISEIHKEIDKIALLTECENLYSHQKSFSFVLKKN